ncbi:PAS domain-containing protein [bacterium]|nr:PAS domain-containing protein [bacterium]
MVSKQYLGTSDTRFLASLLGMLTRVRNARSLQEKLDLLVEGIALCGWRRVHLYLIDHDRKKLVSSAYFGLLPEEVEYLRKNPMSYSEFERIIHSAGDSCRVGIAYYIPVAVQSKIVGSEFAERAVASHIPKEEFNGWNPNDFLVVPIYDRKKVIIGVVSIDDPVDGKPPTVDDMRPVELFIDYMTSLLGEQEMLKYIDRVESILSKVFEASPVGMFILSKSFNIVDLNPMVGKIFGRKREELLGSPIWEIFSYRKQWDGVRKSVKEGGVVRRDVLFRRGVNESFWGYLSIVGVKGEGGDFLGYLAAVQDISGERSLKEYILRAERLIGLGTLSADMALALSNALYAIVGFVEELSRSKSVEDISAYSDEILRLSDEMKRMLKEFVSYSLSRRKGGSSRVNLKRGIEKVLSLLFLLGKTQGVEIKKELEENLFVRANSADIEHLLMNVLLNAFESLRNRKEKRVEIALKRSEEGIVVKVSDTGCGIKKEHLSRVFEPFFTYGKEPMNVGLGLYSSQMIAEKYGGRIDISSRANVGTELVIVFRDGG